MISEKKSVHIVIDAQSHKSSGLGVINQIIGCATGIESGVFAVEQILDVTIEQKLFAEKNPYREIHRTEPAEYFGSGAELVKIPINH